MMSLAKSLKISKASPFSNSFKFKGKGGSGAGVLECIVSGPELSGRHLRVILLVDVIAWWVHAIMFARSYSSA